MRAWLAGGDCNAEIKSPHRRYAETRKSLAVKAERAKKTTVQFIPIRDRGSGTHKCNWCEAVVRGKRKGWNSYHATERLGPNTELRFDGDV